MGSRGEQWRSVGSRKDWRVERGGEIEGRGVERRVGWGEERRWGGEERNGRRNKGQGENSGRDESARSEK